ncbi:MAG TPA: hypothetical protein VFJ70_02940 [Burkholderiales bacterium]|nr:hypothetical protein [Burkholderiales bacterium]
MSRCNALSIVASGLVLVAGLPACAGEPLLAPYTAIALAQDVEPHAHRHDNGARNPSPNPDSIGSYPFSDLAAMRAKLRAADRASEGERTTWSVGVGLRTRRWVATSEPFGPAADDPSRHVRLRYTPPEGPPDSLADSQGLEPAHRLYSVGLRRLF